MIQTLLLSLSWWLIAQGMGLAALPVTRRLFRCLPDQGYAFSKVVGLLLVTYLLWLGASTGLLQNTLGGALLAAALVAVLSLALAFSSGWQPALSAARTFWQEHRSTILTVELLFLFTLVGWALLRAYAPSKIVSMYGEKYMEIAFLNGILRSPQFPPLDPWLSGYAISYYYFGYVMMALFTRLSGVLPTVGFDLYDALLFALTASAAFGVVSNLVSASSGSRQAASRFGLLGALFLTGLGNLEGLVHALYSAGMLSTRLVEWLAIPGLLKEPISSSFYPGHDFYSWWWWRASRVVNDLNFFNQPTGLEPITEFPFFSFLLGDNHPHKLALPFVLLAIALAFNLLLLTARNPSAFRLAQSLEDALTFLGYALTLGALAFLNTWDFPIYLGLVLLAYGAGRALAGSGLSREVLLQTLWQGLLLGAAAMLLYLLFYLGFSSQAGGILPYVFPPTRLPQLLVMFGPFVLILACFFPAVLRVAAPGWRRMIFLTGRIWLGLTALLYGGYLLLVLAAGLLLSRGLLVEGGFSNPDIQRWIQKSAQDLPLTPAQLFEIILFDRISSPWTFLLLSVLISLGLATLWLCLRPSPRVPAAENASEPPETPMLPVSLPTLFAVLMALTGLTLVLSVEFVYLRDSFGVRMNSVFKFYFQSWVLMACAAAYAAWWILRSGAVRPLPRAVFGGAATLLVAAALVYPALGIYSRAHGFAYPPELDASATVAGRYPGHWNSFPDDWAAIQWMRANISGTPVILEASEGSYRNAGRISAFTGFPAVLGWDYHEFQWRGTYEEQSRRLADIRTIYTTPDPDKAFDLLRAWKVSYVIIGNTERNFITSICQAEQTRCDSRRALEKFDALLTPVFTQGETTVYTVPTSP